MALDWEEGLLSVLGAIEGFCGRWVPIYRLSTYVLPGGGRDIWTLKSSNGE